MELFRAGKRQQAEAQRREAEAAGRRAAEEAPRSAVAKEEAGRGAAAAAVEPPSPRSQSTWGSEVWAGGCRAGRTVAWESNLKGCGPRGA